MAAGTESGSPRRRPWAAWRQWRKGRPFWGGLATVLAGAEICAIPLAPLKVMLHQGIAGIPSVLMGLVMILMGLTAWFAPQYRGLAGVLTVMIAAAALVMSNLGGFLIGTLLGVVGGAMIFAWQPRAPLGAPDGGDGPGAAAGGAPAAVPADFGAPPGSGADTPESDTLESDTVARPGSAPDPGPRPAPGP
ncbi:DUF6114 domain-containing protein [Streptomyces sp. NPDC046215]|uniref:Integral membrane protein n=1 Tax=Streptomyces stramineus TaxID=173861 RepID=A0ABP3JR45_9ACTN